jgi:hypothetical protein
LFNRPLIHDPSRLMKNVILRSPAARDDEESLKCLILKMLRFFCR